MASKVNTDIWGSIPASGSIRCNRTLKDLIANNLYNPDTGNFDLSISPWGIGYSNAGNFSIPWYTRTGEATSTSNNRISKIGVEDSKSYNTPFIMGRGIYGLRENYTDEYTRPMQRIYGGTTKDNDNYIVSTVKYDLGDKPPSYHVSASDSVANLQPALYLDYQSIKVVSTALQWINLINGTITRTVLSNPTQYNSYTTAVNSMDLENIGIIAIEYQIYVKNNGSWSAITSDNDYMIHNFKKFKITDRLKQFYFSGDDTDYVQIMPRKYIGVPDLDAAWSMTGGRSIPMESYSYGRLATRHSFDNTFDWGDFAGKASGRFTVGSWSFEDNDYSTDVLSFWGGTNPIREVHENDIIPYTGYIRTCSVTKITRTTAPRNSTAINTVICHELAFLGLPFVNGWSTNYATQNIGDADVYLPIFDEHMITTGRFVRGSDALELPNASWSDILDETMPDYDPRYDPGPKPTEKDIDINNIGRYNKFPSALKMYALNLNEFVSVIDALNAMYVTDPDGVEQWQVDFKGSNPSDYIVGLYATVANVDISQATVSGINVGAINLTDINADAKGYKLPSTLADLDFSCGSVSVPALDDFRDYAPYTQLELYLPLCGTVDLDPAFFVGHKVLVKYWIDILTMSCSAAVYRVTGDYTTLYKVVNGTVGATIPLTALRMGDYQNSIKSIESAMKRNEMQTWLSMASVAEKGATAIASGGGSMLYDAGGLLSGVANVAGNMQSFSDLQYQLYHTQPAIAQTGAAESQNAFCIGSMYPILFIKRAMTLPDYNPTIYGHTVGYACCINDTIGNMSGYTVATNINTEGIAATAEEIEMIKQAFGKGVIL